MTYDPQPIDTSDVELDEDLVQLTEKLAEHNHDIWARQRIADGWVWGASRRDDEKLHPCLVPYGDLPDDEKQYDRNAALETLKVIQKLDYRVVPGSHDREQESCEAAIAYVEGLKGDRQELGRIAAYWMDRREEDAVWRTCLGLYQYLADRFLELGDPGLAREVAAAGLAFEQPTTPGHTIRPWKDDIRLRLAHGSALARMGDTEQAQSTFKRLHDDLQMGQQDPSNDDERHMWEETIGMLARTYKDRAARAKEPSESKRLWRECIGWYKRAWELTGGYWTGINVATLELLHGDAGDARDSAERVRQACEEDLERLRAHNAAATSPRAKKDPYWALATLGEVHLVLDDLEKAESCYREAYREAPGKIGNLHSTRRHAGWLLERRGADHLALLDEWLPIPRVVVFSGHMIDKPDRASPRFPPTLIEPVRQTIKDWLSRERALIGFASAACGADLLFLDAVQELGGESHVILPYEQAEFEADSVRIFGDAEKDDEWSELYEKVVKRATKRVITSPQRLELEGFSYDYANQVLLGLARARADQFATELVGLAVWDGEAGDGLGGTCSAVARWQEKRVPVYQVDLSQPTSAGTERLPVGEVRDRAAAGAEHYRSTDSSLTVASFLFADVVGFSKLGEAELSAFVDHFLGEVARLAAEYDGPDGRTSPIVVRETWGDGVFFAFDTRRSAGKFALEFLKRVEETPWADRGISQGIQVRVALHSGPVLLGKDPITNMSKCIGMHVSRAARLEPITPPGEVYASEAFAALTAIDTTDEFVCDYVEQRKWAKRYGSFPTYRVRRR